MKHRAMSIGMSIMVLLTLLAAVELPFSPVRVAEAGTTIPGGHIISNTTWTSGGSPYWIEGDLVIDHGSTLTINPGVEVRFRGYYSFYVDGVLDAVGTGSNMIEFTSDSPNPGLANWNYIRFNATGTGELEFCILSYGARGIYLDECSDVRISNCVIQYIRYEGIFAYYATNTTISGCEIGHSLGRAIEIRDSMNTTITYNTVYNHYGCAVYLRDSENNTFCYNEIYNSRSGVALNRAHNTVAMYNTILDNNDTAFSSYNSENVRFNENEIFRNGNGVSGLDDFSEMLNNNIYNNEVGISLYYSPNLQLSAMTGNLVNGRDFRDFYYIDQSDIVIDGLDLDSGQKMGYTGNATGQGLITLYNVTNAVITNCRLGPNFGGIYIEDSQSISISQCQISEHYFGVRSYASNEVYIDNNSFFDNKYGIYTSGADYQILDDNEIVGNDRERGIFLRDSRYSTVKGNSVSHSTTGIYLDDVWYSNVNNNVVFDNQEGITLYDSNVSLTGNVMSNNTDFGLSIPRYSQISIPYMSGNIINGYQAEDLYYYNQDDLVISDRIIDSHSLGYTGNLTEQGLITLYNCNNFRILNCTLSNNTNGIYLYSSDRNWIEWTTVHSVKYIGIYMYWGSGFNNIVHCSISRGGRGVVAYWSGYNNVTYSHINECEYGVMLWGSQGNNISYSNISRCTRKGLHSEAGSTGTVITKCIFYNNTYEAWLVQIGHSVYHNNFIDTNITFYLYASTVYENYWSDYTGVDTNGDGIGDTDTPHHYDESPLMEPLELHLSPVAILSCSPTGTVPSKDIEIEVVFDRTMDRDSVENGLTVSDGISTWGSEGGSIEWSQTEYPDDTMTFTPDFYLVYNANYTVHMSGLVMDTNGFTLDGNGNCISEFHPTDDYVWNFSLGIGPPEEIFIDPSHLTCGKDDKVLFATQAYDEDGNLNTSWTPVWEVNDYDIATIDSDTGLFEALDTGSGFVTVRCDQYPSCFNTSDFDILPGPLHHINITSHDTFVFEKDVHGRFSAVGWNDGHETEPNTTWTPKWSSGGGGAFYVDPDTGDFSTLSYGIETLRVEDESTGIYTELEVTVADLTKPVADAGKDMTIYAGEEVRLSGDNSTDNDEIETYEWTIVNWGTIRTLRDNNPEHYFSEPGTYTITLNVTDRSGNWDTDSITVTVINRPEEDEGDDLFLIGLLGLVALIAIGILLAWFFMVKSKKPKPSGPKGFPATQASSAVSAATVQPQQPQPAAVAAPLPLQTILVSCPSCHNTMQVQDTGSMMTVKCPHCSMVLAVKSKSPVIQPTPTQQSTLNISCPQCKSVFPVTSTGDPMQIQCPKCGMKGTVGAG